MIKYIVQTTSSYSDINGNTYHFAKITSTKTKHSVVISDIGGIGAGPGLLFRLKLVNDWSEIYSVQIWEKPREWQRLLRFAKGIDGSFDGSGQVYEHNVTAKMIRRLNRKSNHD